MTITTVNIPVRATVTGVSFSAANMPESSLGGLSFSGIKSTIHQITAIDQDTYNISRAYTEALARTRNHEEARLAALAVYAQRNGVGSAIQNIADITGGSVEDARNLLANVGVGNGNAPALNNGNTVNLAPVRESETPTVSV